MTLSIKQCELALLWGTNFFKFANMFKTWDSNRFCDPDLDRHQNGKSINTVPHDLGDPEEEPWIKVSICHSLKKSRLLTYYEPVLWIRSDRRHFGEPKEELK